MEQNWDKILKFKHISTAAKEAVKYIEDRKEGLIQSLLTRHPKLNNTCMGGIEPNALYTIAGISGSGKSSFANELETDLFDLNPDIDITVLSFNFEMLSLKQVGRKISSKLNLTTSELYSGGLGSTLSDHNLSKVRQASASIKKYDIYYVDSPGNTDDISLTIKYFQEVVAKDRWLVVMLDHTLLTKNQAGDTERETIVKLQKVFVEARKVGKTTIIQLSQLNRDIEDKDRIINPSAHFPMRKDISSSDSVYQSSDYVFVIHRPEILGLKVYGPRAWPVDNYIYLHILEK